MSGRNKKTHLAAGLNLFFRAPTAQLHHAVGVIGHLIGGCGRTPFPNLYLLYSFNVKVKDVQPHYPLSHIYIVFFQITVTHNKGNGGEFLSQDPL